MVKFFLILFLMFLNILLCFRQHHLSACCESIKPTEIIKDSSDKKMNDTLRFNSIREVFEKYKFSI